MVRSENADGILLDPDVKPIYRIPFDHFAPGLLIPILVLDVAVRANLDLCDLVVHHVVLDLKQLEEVIRRSLDLRHLHPFQNLSRDRDI